MLAESDHHAIADVKRSTCLTCPCVPGGCILSAAADLALSSALYSSQSSCQCCVPMWSDEKIYIHIHVYVHVQCSIHYSCHTIHYVNMHTVNVHVHFVHVHVCLVNTCACQCFPQTGAGGCCTPFHELFPLM